MWVNIERTTLRSKSGKFCNVTNLQWLDVFGSCLKVMNPFDPSQKLTTRNGNKIKFFKFTDGWLARGCDVEESASWKKLICKCPPLLSTLWRSFFKYNINKYKYKYINLKEKSKKTMSKPKRNLCNIYEQFLGQLVYLQLSLSNQIKDQLDRIDIKINLLICHPRMSFLNITLCWFLVIRTFWG